MNKNKLVPVFDFFFKQAGDGIFICASSCQKLSLYSTILQSYCKNEKGAIFMPHSVYIYIHVYDICTKHVYTV